MLEDSNRQGALFRQFADRVETYRHACDLIEFDEVVGDDSAMQKDIAASVYEAQTVFFNSVIHESHERDGKFDKAYRKMMLKHTKQLATMYRAGVTSVPSRP
jgi:hypothetical protein